MHINSSSIFNTMSVKLNWVNFKPESENVKNTYFGRFALLDTFVHLF